MRTILPPIKFAILIVAFPIATWMLLAGNPQMGDNLLVNIIEWKL